ncbi:hypothetical protein [Rheinheimera aquimaris]|jgi:hypothetical protein|uniref:hypothetical protein n=3 Tax=Rheinheimera aquimaris TaxID=412437 RepID=UPI0026A3F4D8
MEKTKSDQDRRYARWTFMTGTRPFEGIEMILLNMVESFEEVTSHQDGSFSVTNDLIARNAISHTAIVMSYSLLEGFFHEEFEYYMKNKNQRKPKELSALINTLLHEHKISLKDWRKRRKVIDLLRVLRNAVVHCNGIIGSEIDKEKCKELMGEDIFESSEHYPRLSLARSISLVRELKSIADEYAEAVIWL